MPGREHPVSRLEGFSRRGALALSPQEEISLHFGQRAPLHGWNGYRLGQALEVADRAA